VPELPATALCSALGASASAADCGRPVVCYAAPMTDQATEGPRCSFCEGEDQGEVIVAGARAFICSDCVLGAIEVIGAEQPQWLAELIAALTHEP
jgi:hypothetical protein